MDVIGIGALNVDRLYFVSSIARGGEEVSVYSETVAPGGSAANTIVALSRLGLRTGFVGMIGTDEDSKLVLEDLKKEKVDTKGLKRLKGATGKILGFVDKTGERALYAYPGVNDKLSIDKGDLEYIKEAGFVHLSSFVGEKSYRAQKGIIKKVQKISFSPGALYARKGLEELVQFIENCHVMFINREEIELLTGSEYKIGAKELLELGVEIVAVTLGEDGCFVMTKGGSHLIPAYKTKVVDTTGAGDAFAAGFLYGLMKERDIKSCGNLGNYLASRCISKKGARAGLPYRLERNGCR